MFTMKVIQTVATLASIVAGPPLLAANRSQSTAGEIALHARASSPEQENTTAKRMGAKTFSLPTGHRVMLAQPKELA